MIPVAKSNVSSYRPDVGGDPLKVEKGWCHFSSQGVKDFLDHITGYEPVSGGVCFEVSTFRGAKAWVNVSFVSETAFRFR